LGKSLKTLYERRETFIKHFEELESSRDRPRASSAPTLPEGVTEKDFIQFASAYVKQSRDQ
jgi:hypothetical protein